MFTKLATKSLLNRKGSVLLTILAMTVSVFVLLGVEHIRHQAKESFANTVSGVDLIVGARSGSLNLLLYSVFRVGSPTNNVTWESYKDISSHSQVAWSVPISLGDSHKGYRVMGTTQDYFQYFSYGNKHKLSFDQGMKFESTFDVVLGAEVANQLGYSLGQEIVLSHGTAATSFSLHDDRPFTIVGVLEPTGTPVDQTLHVSLEGIEAIHIDWNRGVRIPGSGITIKQLEQADLTPDSVTAFLLGLKSRIATFAVQRQINEYRNEPLLAILPGVALSELWQMMKMLENTLRLISVLVLIAALLGLSAMLLASIRERIQEIQLLRVIGASPKFLFLLIELEALIITLLSTLFGALLLYMCLLFTENFLAADFGLYIETNIFTPNTLMLLLFIVIATLVAVAIPSLSAYRNARSV
ncbi:MAG: ABC transporter permease [Acidiferrobacterales bacterium]|nr:ABC transporter permease [Acidiferrobacterales bacterium]